MASKEHIRNELQACKEALLRCNAGGPAQGNAKLATHGLIDCDELKRILGVIDVIYKETDPTALVDTIAAGTVHLQMRAMALTLRLRTQAITLLSMVENFKATWSLFSRSDAALLSTIKANQFRLDYTKDTFREAIKWYVNEGTTLRLPESAREPNRAMQKLLTKQRYVIEQQLMATLVAAMQAAEEKGIARQDGTVVKQRSASSPRSRGGSPERGSFRSSSSERRPSSASGTTRPRRSPSPSPRYDSPRESSSSSLNPYWDSKNSRTSPASYGRSSSSKRF
jgi:hypothetical protein